MERVKYLFSSLADVIEREDGNQLAAKVFKEMGRKCYLDNDEMMATARKLHNRLPENSGEKDTIVEFLAANMEDYTFSVTEQGFTVDLNNRKCFCPLVNQGYFDNPLLCECTRGFDKNMYEDILGRQVEVEVLSSLLGGGDSCRFAVILK